MCVGRMSGLWGRTSQMSSVSLSRFVVGECGGCGGEAMGMCRKE